MGSIRRLLIIAPLVPWLAVSAVIAREHVHESHAADHASIAHRHFAPHIQNDNQLSHHDHDNAELSDVDGEVIWMDEVGLAEASRAFPRLLVILFTPVQIVRELPVHVAAVADEATLAHGPPRVAPPLRGPPFPSL